MLGSYVIVILIARNFLEMSPGPSGKVIPIARGGTPLYQVYRYVPPQKTGIDFEHFGLKLGMVIGGTFTKAYKLIFLPSNGGE